MESLFIIGHQQYVTTIGISSWNVISLCCVINLGHVFQTFVYVSVESAVTSQTCFPNPYFIPIEHIRTLDRVVDLGFCSQVTHKTKNPIEKNYIRRQNLEIALARVPLHVRSKTGPPLEAVES